MKSLTSLHPTSPHKIDSDENSMDENFDSRSPPIENHDDGDLNNGDLDNGDLKSAKSLIGKSPSDYRESWPRDHNKYNEVANPEEGWLGEKEEEPPNTV